MRDDSDYLPSLEHTEPKMSWGKVRYELEHVPDAANMTGIMLNEKVHGIEGHFFRGHFRPCRKVDCDGCENGAPWKWNGYFFAWNPTTKIIWIVGIPPGPYPTFKAFLEEHGTCRGAKFCLWRPDKHSTGQVAARLTMPSGVAYSLPKCPEIREPLLRIFYGGYKNQKFIDGSVDPSPVQTQFVKDLPRGVEPIAETVNRITRNKKSNGTLH